MRIPLYLIFVCSILNEVNGFIRNKKKTRYSPNMAPNMGLHGVLDFQQRLDHFDESNKIFWTQRTWSNDRFFDDSDSPIFLMVEGEGEASPYWMNRGAWMEWAEEHKAMLYMLEHRYYGESHPTDDVTTENLSYLTSEQALADIAYFINETNSKNNYTANNKWILFGGSYPGNLAAWARLHYPGQVFGAVSSSSPLMAKANFHEYADIVRDVLNSEVPGCADELSKAIKDMQQMMTDESGSKQLLSKFKICEEIFNYKNELDPARLYTDLQAEIGNMVQYNYQSENNPDVLSVAQFCNVYVMNETLGNPVDRLAAYFTLNRNASIKCDNITHELGVSGMQETMWNSTAVITGGRQWIYQTCNEFGYYLTSESKTSLYSDTVPFKAYIQRCADIFGNQFNEQQLLQSVENVNKRNQGTDINVTNVIFLQGTKDPWHVLGEVKNPTDSSPYVLIEGTGHYQDIEPPMKSDPPSLTAARELIRQTLRKWLAV